MLKYILRRLLLVIPILLGVVFIVFFIMSMTPSSPGRIILGMQASAEEVETLNEELGFNKPLLIRYVNYVKSIATGDFGLSYRTQKPALDDIMERFPITLRIAILSILISALIGIPFGIISAVKQYSVIDMTVTVIALILASIPVFWLGIMLLLVFSLKIRLLPSSGFSTPAHYILPLACMALPAAAGLMRLTRTTMLETIRADYIRTARAKGVSERAIIWKHSIRNALLPVITTLGMQFAMLLGGALFVERVFNIPGIGNLILRAIQFKDVPVVMGATVLLATLFCLIMIAVDILYGFIDPRIKSRFMR